MMTIKSSQRTRLAILVLYLLGLLIISKVAIGTWLPPTTNKGIWFYSALASLLLGNLLVSPFFTKPVDAISYAVALLIALLPVMFTVSGFDRFLWILVISYCGFVIVTAILSIAFKDSTLSFWNRSSKSLYVLSETIGNPRAIFSIVFLFALVTFHRETTREYLLISLAWIIFIGFRPIEGILYLVGRWRAIWRQKVHLNRLGEVIGHEVPNIVLIREDTGQQANFGDVIIVRSDDGQPGYAVALDHVGYADGRWLRAVHVSKAIRELSVNTSDGSSYIVEEKSIEQTTPNRVLLARDRLLGLVAPDTTVSRLNVEIVRDDLSLQQGSLVEVKISGNEVMYQIVDGITREEIIQQKNTRGFVRAVAKKIGTWNSQCTRFDPIPWLPQPNEAVLLVTQEEASTEKDAVGHFPGTKYPVRIDSNQLVIHNTAILGILGIGKSFLALELVERMIEKNIKVICFDLTNQYAKELSIFYEEESCLHEIEELNQIGRTGKTRVSQNVEEGGSINAFTLRIKEHLQAFLDTRSNSKLRIYNPAYFEVWRQDSKMFKETASMASLTPCEVTRIITETTLEVLQDQGMTDAARCCLVYEEAHSLIPEWNAVACEGDKTATNGTAKAILQGRKYGLGCLVITQRTANVTKSILNQCNTVFALRVFDATGMEFLSNYIGDDYAGVLSSLEERYAVVFGRASSCCDPVLIRLNDRDKFLEVFRHGELGPSSEEIVQ